MTLASELVWELVPPLVLASEDFVLSALLEPCYDIGGDAFDYALDGGVLHFAVFDAMGHGLAAAGMASRALSAYRHSRRNGDGPAAAYTAIDAALAGQQDLASRFVTALIAELDLATGALRWVSAGHPAPLLLRDGRLVKTLDVAPSPPLALELAAGPPVEGRESLEPGDMVLLYTDGLTEARRPGGELFTVERLGEFIEREAASGRAAPETLRRLREAIIERGARRPERRRHRRARRMAARHRAHTAARHRLSHFAIATEGGRQSLAVGIDDRLRKDFGDRYDPTVRLGRELTFTAPVFDNARLKRGHRPWSALPDRRRP